MHESARHQMVSCLAAHLKPGRHYRILDLGSAVSRGQSSTHRDLLAPYNVSYLGVDIVNADNVDRVMDRPYGIPARSNSADVVISGQVFEHIPFPWASMLEIRRVLKPSGLVILTAPSRGNRHDVFDCWRYYPDSMRALAAWGEFELVESYTDFPPVRRGSKVRHDYAAITQDHYWGDTVAVMRKSGRTSLKSRLFSKVLLAWANRHADLRDVPLPPTPAGRL